MRSTITPTKKPAQGLWIGAATGNVYMDITGALTKANLVVCVGLGPKNVDTTLGRVYEKHDQHLPFNGTVKLTTE